MMEINWKSLHDAVKLQRDRALESEAKNMAAVSILSAEVERLQAIIAPSKKTGSKSKAHATGVKREP